MLKQWYEETFKGTIREFRKSFGKERSPLWRKTRNAYVKRNPECEICGKDETLQVHHIIPFHIDPRKELLFSNLVTLCKNCHLTFGHLRWWVAYNENIEEDVKIWHNKIKNRKTK